MPEDKNKEKKAKKYGHGLSDKQWQALAEVLLKSKKQTGKAGRFPLELRQVMNAILHVVKTGCQWRMLPNDYPHYKTLYQHYNSWSKKRIWERSMGS